MIITFEGGEGSGKGTIARRLFEHLSKEHKVVLGREPGTSEISEEIRKVIQKPRREMNPRTELLLFEAARAQFTDEWLKPAMKDNDYVILDRFYDSTTAYQGYGRGLDLELIKRLNLVAADNIVPDVTFILDVDPKVGLKRLEKDEFGEADRIEQETLEFHNNVRKGYLKMADQPRFIVIDAGKHNADEVFEIVKKKILDYSSSSSAKKDVNS